MPMHRWMARAAGGTNQRLKPGRAMMRSFDRKPGALAKVPAATVLLMDQILLIGRVQAKRRKGSSIK
ncbi:hypothetical protein PPUN110474_19010 [Pseudomonas putida]|nr:hypothetical protein PPUN110474_19010 [Pseudomonas putida]